MWVLSGHTVVDELDPTLQFKAGGGTTVRAFKQDELTPEPGNYELILNQELRFPLLWKFSGVAFMDAGQTAARAQDFFSLRYSPGFGIRIQTPFILLRTDLGINAWPRPGEALECGGACPLDFWHWSGVLDLRFLHLYWKREAESSAAGSVFSPDSAAMCIDD